MGPLSFQVGDSVGVLPENDHAITDLILNSLQCKESDTYFDLRSNTTLSIREFFLKRANLSKCTSSLLKLLKERGAKSDLLSTLLIPDNKAQLIEFLQTHHLIDILKAFPSPDISPQELCAALLPLMPRFYSIASSIRMFPDEIHLTVASLVYPTAGGPRHGVGSHFLCHYAQPMTPVPLFVQSSNGFTLPADPDASIILIGPGTGIAPFRAFLQERIALQQQGRTWLFFGERNQSTDFYYADFWLELEKQGRLRLDLAFSRDSSEKIYVQHRLWEQRASIWDWIQNGAYIFICGDAEKMARDVDATFLKIGCDQGALTEEASREWLKRLRKDRRYLQDVY